MLGVSWLAAWFGADNAWARPLRACFDRYPTVHQMAEVREEVDAADEMCDVGDCESPRDVSTSSQIVTAICMYGMVAPLGVLRS